MLHNGTYPHDSANAINKIIHNRIRLPHSSLPPDARDLLSRLLQVDPAERLPVEGILFHPYYTAFIDEHNTNNNFNNNSVNENNKNNNSNNNKSINNVSPLTMHYERNVYNSPTRPTSDDSNNSNSDHLNASLETKQGHNV